MSWLSKITNRQRPRLSVERPKGIPERPLPSIVGDEVSIEGTDLLNYVRQEYKQSLNEDNRWSMFDKKSSNYTPVGSIITVHYREVLTGQDTSFTGFMLALRRHAANPTIILRSIISGVAVEQVFSVFSPTIRKIECSRKATCLYGHKAYWIRDNPDWVSRFFAKPDQKITIRKVRARNKALREQERLEKESKLTAKDAVKLENNN
jgi:ribosomal protein L19